MNGTRSKAVGEAARNLALQGAAGQGQGDIHPEEMGGGGVFGSKTRENRVEGGRTAPLRKDARHIETKEGLLCDAKLDKGVLTAEALAQNTLGMHDVQRMKIKQMQEQSSSLRETQISPPRNLFSGSGTSVTRASGGELRTSGSAQPQVDPYLLKLLGQGVSIQGSKATSSTEFRVPKPVARTRIKTKSSGPQSVDKGLQGSNSDKASKGTDTDKESQWTLTETQATMGKEATNALRSSVVQHQKMYLEQLYDLHRAIAVQVGNCICSSMTRCSEI